MIVYFLLHTERDSDGNIKVKTIGKMLDEKLTVEGTATIVLMTNVVDGKYTFQTQNSGKDICKSPMGMFQNYLIDNDLKMVDGIIREYYELSDVKPEEKGVLEEKPMRGSRRAIQKAAEKQAEETLNQIAGEKYVPTNDTVPPTEGKRTRKKIDDGLTDEQREAFKAEMEAKNKAYEESLPERKKRDVTEISETETVETPEEPKRSRKTLAEKLAEGGFSVPEPIETADATPTRPRRRRVAGE